MTRLETRRPVPPRLRTLLIVVLALLLGGGVGRLSTVVLRPPLVLGQDAAYPGAAATVRLGRDPGTFIDIQPESGRAQTLLILYPG